MLDECEKKNKERKKMEEYHHYHFAFPSTVFISSLANFKYRVIKKKNKQKKATK